jgi:hypothetical protein
MTLRCRFAGLFLISSSLFLSGCASAGGVFDDGTIFKGKQAWESKRHADDWIEPIADGAVAMWFIPVAVMDPRFDKSTAYMTPYYPACSPALRCRDRHEASDRDDTLFSGKQPDERKRHADDWAEPLLNGLSGAK